MTKIPNLLLKFPTKSRHYEAALAEKGVPRVAFQFRKLDLNYYLQPALFETPQNKFLKTSLQQQYQAFNAVTNRLFKPRLIIIGTNPGGVGYVEATRFILWLVLQAYQRRNSVSGNEPLWYPIYNNRDDRLIRYYPDDLTRTTTGIETPSFLVLDNLYPNSGERSLNKAQDIINYYRYKIPVYVIVKGITGHEFSYSYIHIQANYYFQFGSGSRAINL